MFNKREANENSDLQERTAPAPRAENAKPASGKPATIGPTVQIEGRMESQEDLILEGRFKGTISLKKNTLTVGENGSLEAEVHAHTLLVDGTVNGDLYASERLNIRKSARITGNIYAPRISLEDGARFRGSIDMDPDSEAYCKVFGGKSAPAVGSNPQPKPSAAPADIDRNKGAAAGHDHLPQADNRQKTDRTG